MFHNSQLENLHVFQQTVHDGIHFEGECSKISVFKNADAYTSTTFLFFRGSPFSLLS